MGTRLDYTRLEQEYPNRGKQTYRKLLTGYKALLQRDYGLAQDCTLTCLACIFGAEHYGDIERVAQRHGYNGDTYGTHPWTVKPIMAEFMAAQGLHGSAKAAYGKGIGWCFGTVRRLIEGGMPVVLNLWRDGRGYYADHSVVIIGVEEYRRARFLVVYDCWNDSASLIDYNKLSMISGINWRKI